MPKRPSLRDIRTFLNTPLPRIQAATLRKEWKGEALPAGPLTYRMVLAALDPLLQEAEQNFVMEANNADNSAARAIVINDTLVAIQYLSALSEAMETLVGGASGIPEKLSTQHASEIIQASFHYDRKTKKAESVMTQATRLFQKDSPLLEHRSYATFLNPASRLMETIIARMDEDFQKMFSRGRPGR